MVFFLKKISILNIIINFINNISWWTNKEKGGWALRNYLNLKERNRRY